MENEKPTRETLPEGAYLLLEFLFRYHAREIAHMYAKENCLDDIKDVYQYYGYSEDLLDAVGWDDSSETYTEDTTDIATQISDALESFLSIYKPGNIIYPAAVARHLGISVAATYSKLDDYEKMHNDIQKIYLLRCPKCGQFLAGRYPAIVDMYSKSEVVCDHCDSMFVPNPETDGYVVYLKM